MTLFPLDASINILPHDGIVHYHGAIFHAQKSKAYYQRLMDHIDWKHDEARMFGKHIITKRKVAWYA